MTSNPYRTAGEPADAAVALLLAREIASDDTASYVDQPAATILARALLAAHEENERLREEIHYMGRQVAEADSWMDDAKNADRQTIARLRSALKEALDGWSAADVSDHYHSGDGYISNNYCDCTDRIAALRKEFGV